MNLNIEKKYIERYNNEKYMIYIGSTHVEGLKIHHLKAQPLCKDTSKEICWGEAWERLGMMRGGLNQRINDNNRSMV